MPTAAASLLKLEIELGHNPNIVEISSKSLTYRHNLEGCHTKDYRTANELVEELKVE